MCLPAGESDMPDFQALAANSAAVRTTGGFFTVQLASPFGRKTRLASEITALRAADPP